MTKREIQLALVREVARHNKLKAAVKRRAKQFRKSSEKYNEGALINRKDGYIAEANRYEGESIAFRWCAEDLEKILG